MKGGIMPTEAYDPLLFSSEEEFKEAQAIFGEAHKDHLEGNPIGTYQVLLEDVVWGKSQSSDKWQITWTLKIVGGKIDGKTLMKYSGFGSPQQAKMSMDELKKLGVDTAKLSLNIMPAICLSLKGKMASVKTQQNKEFYNIYFLKLIRQVNPKTTQPAGQSGKAPAGKF
jgi:hypothetical protein